MHWDDVPVHLQVHWDVRECTAMHDDVYPALED